MKRIRFKRVTLSLTATIIALGLNVNEAMAFNSTGKKLNEACEKASFEPIAPYQVGDCLLCHDDDNGDFGEDGGSGDGKSAWEKDNLEFFCQAPAPAPVDTDGDDVIDDNDECIDEVGPAFNNGCPIPPADTDGDGVIDDDDKCIHEMGPADNNGCPLSPAAADTDGDGVIDDDDKCIDETGPAENNGCPLPPAAADTDGDGIMDAVDDCIDESGPADNNGCPLPPTVDNSAPMLYLIPDATLTVGDELYIELKAKDPDGDILSLIGSGLWDFDVQDNGDGTGSVMGTATNPGTHYGIVRVSDGMHNDFQMLKVTVLPVEPEVEPTHFFEAKFQYNHTLKRLKGKLQTEPFNNKKDEGKCELFSHTAFTGSDANGNVVFVTDLDCEGGSIEWIPVQADKVPCSITLTADKVVTETFKVSGCDHDDYADTHIVTPESDTPDDQGDTDTDIDERDSDEGENE